MIFTCDILKTGYEKRVTDKGEIYETLTAVPFDENETGSMNFNIKPDCIFEGFNKITELPRFAHCILYLKYLKTSKGDFFILDKIKKLDK